MADDSAAAADTPPVPSTYIVIMANRVGISWVLANGKMALAKTSRGANSVKAHDYLLFYSTKGCYPRNRGGHLFGTASVTSSLRQRAEPLSLQGRQFQYEFDFVDLVLAPYGTGLELTSVLQGLPKSFPSPHMYAVQGRALVPVHRDEADGLRERAAQWWSPNHTEIDAYLEWLPTET